MRKAQEEELQKERNKFLSMIAKTYSQSELEALQTQHEYVLILCVTKLPFMLILSYVCIYIIRFITY